MEFTHSTARFTHQGRITVSGSYDDEKGEVYIEVNDTGIGIAPQNIDRIFQPFDQEEFVEKSRKTDLGSSVVKKRFKTNGILIRQGCVLSLHFVKENRCFEGINIFFFQV